MNKSLFFPSGNPSLKVVRELLSIIPAAVVITDADDGAALAISPEAERMLGMTLDQVVDITTVHEEPSQWIEAVRVAGEQPGKVFKLAGKVTDASGKHHQVVGSFTMGQMAGRRVIITVMEPGLPLPELDTV